MYNNKHEECDITYVKKKQNKYNFKRLKDYTLKEVIGVIATLLLAGASGAFVAHIWLQMFLQY